MTEPFSIENILKEKRDEIMTIARKHGATNVRVFGSVARGEADEASDIDLLVDMEPVHSPWFPVGIEMDLSEMLDRKVEVVTEDSIYWLLRRKIVKEALPL